MDTNIGQWHHVNIPIQLSNCMHTYEEHYSHILCQTKQE